LIGATDASTDGIGGCEAPVSNELAGALFRKSDIRGERVSLQNVLHKDPGRDRPTRKKDTIAPTVVRPMLIAIHAFSGARRVEDVHFFWVRLGWSRGYDVKVLDFDLSIASNHDFMNNGFFEGLLAFVYSGLVAWVLGGPPCNSWSSARHTKNGPPPVRDRQHLWGRPKLTNGLKTTLHVGNVLFLRFLQLCWAVVLAARGRPGNGHFVLEHPKDMGRQPFPSCFITPEVRALKTFANCEEVSFDQCEYGAAGKKPTTLLGTPALKSIERHCTHKHHTAILGKTSEGTFKTSGFQIYPSSLCESIAEVFVESLPSPEVFNALCEFEDPGVEEALVLSLKNITKKETHFHFLPPHLISRAECSRGGSKVFDSCIAKLSTVQASDSCFSELPSISSPDLQLGEDLLNWDWKVIFSYTTTAAEHINLKELRGALTWLRRHSRSFCPDGKRLILLCDSRVATGALNKGRSPSALINSLLRKCLPHLLAGELHLSVLWIPSKANPADYPSRFKSLNLWKHELRAEKLKRQRAACQSQLGVASKYNRPWTSGSGKSQS
jgi:hypothetical protein